MSDYIIQSGTLESIANAIREKKGTTDLIPVTSLASEISSIESGSNANIVYGSINTNKTQTIRIAGIPRTPISICIAATHQTAKYISSVGRFDLDGTGIGVYKATLYSSYGLLNINVTYDENAQTVTLKSSTTTNLFYGDNSYSITY